MASGIDKSKIARDKRGWNGYSLYPRYSRKYGAPTEKQIKYLKHLWGQLNEHGFEYSYNKRALIDQRELHREIKHAYDTAKKLGIEFRRMEPNDN